MYRRVRVFKRWMKSQGIDVSDALHLTDTEAEGISVRALCDLNEGDLVATIPKQSCLTMKTSAARPLIESAGLDGALGLSFAVMYERSLGEQSQWAGYLQLLPEFECLPLLWSPFEIDTLLSGTELHKIVKEDKGHIKEDWKACIMPLVGSADLHLDSRYFGVEQYFAAKSLVASRSFEIDDFHGFGMVPFADLFNHRTGDEDVHFTCISSHDDNGINDEQNNDKSVGATDEDLEESSFSGKRGASDGDEKSSHSGSDLQSSLDMDDDSMVLEMIIIKHVKAGAEVFNTYGLMGNSALLHRYGFTELENKYDIVNIDLELILKWCTSRFSSRYARARLLLWRRLGYSGCVSQNSEYFEISYQGEPQIELLLLLYVMLLPDEAYQVVDISASVEGNADACKSTTSEGDSQVLLGITKMSKDLLLTVNVREALLELADIRDHLYGPNSIEDDVDRLNRCCGTRERKMYHSLVLRVSERGILKKLKNYAATCAVHSLKGARKKMKSH
ncbi:SET domain [Dillenia turbinata]|uniref:N-lysine methyltransferase n=1 Tax=Dillenia turbinata TaxID=194707 RepID=A0AAN8UZF5_9MAGN